MSLPAVSAVIVSWNNKRATLKAVEAVLAQRGEFDLKVTVVDNHSTDGTAEAIKEKFSNVKVIVNEINLGGAGGFYVGIQASLASRCDYLWLLDNDAYAQPNCIENVIKVLEKKDQQNIIAAGSMTVMSHFPLGLAGS